MKVHEHQAKQLLNGHGIEIPNGYVAFTEEEALEAGKKLQAKGIENFVVKAQIHAGGRGKGGGVKLARSLDELKTTVSQILGMTLVTHQTGPEGQLVRRLWIEEANPPRQESYFSLIMDRTNRCVSLLAAAEGGMDIEEMAEKSPEKLLSMTIDPLAGWQPYHSRRLFDFLGYSKETAAKRLFKESSKLFSQLYDFFVQKDCSMLELNPLCLCGEGEATKLILLDAKLNFDENALPRHPELLELRDLDEEDPKEVEASKYDLNFISLDGNIGCMVNGAGLAMATMDNIKAYGGEPANFLDVGGGATVEKVCAAFKIILSDSKVKAIFVNIFGGIMKCDVIANGIVTAAKEVSLAVPLVVRLEGTNVKAGREILQKSGLDLITADSLNDGSQKVVAAMQGAKS